MSTIVVKFISFFRQYWYVFAIIAIVIVLKMLFSRYDSNISDMFQKIQKSHNDEISSMKLAAEKREQANVESLKRLESRLNQIESEYVLAKQQLEQKKTSEIKIILDTSKDDPDKLAKHFSLATGFRIVMVDSQ
jgi:hypothetical protein